MPKWYAAMESEFQALLQNETWTLVYSPSGKNVITNKWVFKTKQRPDGSLDRRKPRLVAIGCHQWSGLDFHETFSPVIKPSTVRLILALASLLTRIFDMASWMKKYISLSRKGLWTLSILIL